MAELAFGAAAGVLAGARACLVVAASTRCGRVAMGGPPEGAGGETLYSNAHLVYEILPPALRSRIEHLQVVHSTAVIPQSTVISSPAPDSQRRVTVALERAPILT